MRTWFWTLLVFVGAVALALLLRDHSGNILILVHPWRIELSLTLAVLFILAAFVVLHIVLRLFAWVTGSPQRFRSWRGTRAQRRDHNLLESGWVNLLEGRYEQADKDLSRLLGKTHSKTSKVVAALASARAAHRQGHRARRDDLIVQARSNAGNSIRLENAVAIVQAELYLDDNRPQDALVLLKPLHDNTSRQQVHTSRLLLRAYRQLGDYDRVYDLARSLLRRGALEQPDAAALISWAGAARLRAAGMDGFKAVWSDLKADERTFPAIALMAADVQTLAGHYDDAAGILEAAIAGSMDPQLLAAYAQCPPDHAGRRLGKAEVWLKTHPDDPALLATLGALCIALELWGQAERYLLRSMRIRNDMRIHALLGNLYDGLGRPADAAKHWRLASGVAGKLPVLAVNHVLPAADLRGDPTLLDVDPDSYSPESEGRIAAADMAVPVAASAAGFTEDRLALEGNDRPAPDASRTADTPPDPDTGLDEYFDTAPIPGVDMSQTSDRPHGTDRARN